MRPAVFLLGLIGLVLTLAPPAHATTAPPGFVIEPAFPGAAYEVPLQILFLPDGRKFIVEMRGKLKVIAPDGTELPTPFIDITDKVECCGGRGLLSAALDPDFATNRWVYLFYVVDPESSGVDFVGDQPECYTRIERYQASLSDPNVADLSSRQVLFGADWPGGSPVADVYHTAGTLWFAPDKSLLASTGDGAHFDQTDAGGLDPNQFGPGRSNPAIDMGSFRSRSLDNLSGKVLRLDKETGHGLPSNPFWDGNPMSARSRIWVYGLRNPFRFAMRPGTGAADPNQGQPGTLYIGETGWNTYEEVNVAPAGGLNFGWPCYEGPLSQPLYNAVTSTASGNTHVLCGAAPSAENPSPSTQPLLWWHHTDGSLSNPVGWMGRAVISGVFQTGGNYPAPYQGAYYVIDYINGWMRWVNVDATNQVVSSGDFITALPDTEHIWTVECDPATGDLYYLCERVNTIGGNVYRVRYLGTATPKTVSFRADSATGAGPAPIPSAASPWKDLAGTHDAALSSFAGTATSGWQGDGSAEQPYRLQFDGVDDRATVPAQSIAELQSPTAATAALWFETGDDVTSSQSLYEWVSTYASPYAGMRIGIAGGQLRVWLNPWVNVGALQPNTWYHVAVAKDTTGARVYMNGQLVATSANGCLGPQTSELVLGCSTYQGAHAYQDFFTGAMASAATWSAGLSGDEILATYQAGLPLFTSSATKVVTLAADSSAGGGPYPSPGAGSPWSDLTGAHTAALKGFNGTSQSGWMGDGSLVAPHRLAFDGIDDHVTIPGGSVAGLQNLEAATASAWFRTGVDVLSQQVLLEWVSSYSAPFPGMTVGLGGGKLRVWLSDWVDVAPVVPNTWYNVTVVKSAADARVFVNGIRLYRGTTVDLGGQMSEIVLGASTRSGPGVYDSFFHGSIGKVTLWRHAILDPEAQEYEHEDAATYLPPYLGMRAIEVRADSADGAHPYAVPSGDPDWHNVAGGPDGALSGFAGTAQSGWTGGPSLGPNAPYRLQYDGVDDHVTFPAGIPALTSLEAASVSLWFMTGLDVTRFQNLVEWLGQFASPYPGMTVGIQNGMVRLWLTQWLDLMPVKPFTWHHVVITKGDNAVNAYVDGLFVYAGPSPNLGSAASETVVGASTRRGSGNYGDYFTGAIGEFDAWPAPLTPDDVQALFAAGMHTYTGSWSTVSVPPQAIEPGLWLHPNPFAQDLSIDFAITRPGAVRLDIFDIHGRRVRTLANAVLVAGRHHRNWNGHDDAGAPVGAGVWFARLRTPDGRFTRRLVSVH